MGTPSIWCTSFSICWVLLFSLPRFLLNWLIFPLICHPCGNSFYSKSGWSSLYGKGTTSDSRWPDVSFERALFLAWSPSFSLSLWFAKIFVLGICLSFTGFLSLFKSRSIVFFLYLKLSNIPLPGLAQRTYWIFIFGQIAQVYLLKEIDSLVNYLRVL